MRNTTVAFRGADQVLGAYRANDMPSWAICSGKELMFAHECATCEDGENMLCDLLKKMEQGASRAIFTLRVYKIKKGEEITSTTPYHRSFNFLLYDEEMGNYHPYDRGIRDATAKAEDRINKLEAEIQLLRAQVDSEEEEEESPGGLNGIIAGILGQPGVKEALIQGAGTFIQNIIPMRNMRPGAVAGIDPVPQQELQSVLTPEQQLKAQHALNVLCSIDPNLGDHLEGIAQIARDNPRKYNNLVGMLKII